MQPYHTSGSVLTSLASTNEELRNTIEIATLVNLDIQFILYSWILQI